MGIAALQSRLYRSADRLRGRRASDTESQFCGLGLRYVTGFPEGRPGDTGIITRVTPWHQIIRGHATTTAKCWLLQFPPKLHARNKR